MHTLRKISEHVYWFSPRADTDRPALAAVIGTRYTVMLDAGNSSAHVAAFFAALEAEGLRRPDFCAITHAHWDHFFGGAAVRAPLIAHDWTARQVAVQAGYDWSDAALDQRVEVGLEIAFCRDMIKAELPDRRDFVIAVPEIVFNDELWLDLGGVECRVFHVGGDHAADSCVMHVPADRMLFLGDCIYPAIYAPQRYHTVEKVLALVDRLDACAADWVVAGHHETVMTRADWQQEAHIFRTVADLVRRCGADLAKIRHEINSAALPDPEWALELAGYYLQGEQSTRA